MPDLCLEAPTAQALAALTCCYCWVLCPLPQKKAVVVFDRHANAKLLIDTLHRPDIVAQYANAKALHTEGLKLDGHPENGSLVCGNTR